MKLFICCGIFSLFTVTVTTNCDNLGTLLYEDLGCLPHYKKPNSCPTKYTCRALETSNNQCYYKNKLYQIDEIVDNSISNASCFQSCRCAKDKETAHFQCTVLDCDEWLDNPIGPGCYRQYSLDGCCAIGQSCPPHDKVETCVVDGREYKEGQIFYPKKTCLRCACKKGFTGKLVEPFCKRKTCDVQLEKSIQSLYQGCAPLYGPKLGALCCPFGWICPDGFEKINVVKKSDEVCIFGKKFLKLGESFDKLNAKNGFGETIKKIVCECVVPPLLTCNVAVDTQGR